MKKRSLILALSLLLLGSNLLAADGDLIVSGKVGIGTTAPARSLDLSRDGQITFGDNGYSSTGSPGIWWYSSNSTYGIYKTAGDWSNPNFQQLKLSFPTGIVIDGGSSYGKSGTILQPDGGNVGIGTTTFEPGYILKVQPPGAGGIQIDSTGIGNSGYSSLYLTSADGGSGQIWKYSGTASGYGGAASLNIYNSGGNIAFHSNVVQNAMVLTNGGNVGIGTTSPGSYNLYVNGSTYSTGGWGGSDIRWKKNIQPIENALSLVGGLQGVKYEWRTEEFNDKNFDAGRQVGLIAQDVEKVIPEIVKTDSDGYKALSYEKLTAVLVEAIKEQQKAFSKEIESLKAEIERLKGK